MLILVFFLQDGYEEILSDEEVCFKCHVLNTGLKNVLAGHPVLADFPVWLMLT